MAPAPWKLIVSEGMQSSLQSEPNGSSSGLEVGGMALG